jgi:hypothetical protein
MRCREPPSPDRPVSPSPIGAVNLPPGLYPKSPPWPPDVFDRRLPNSPGMQAVPAAPPYPSKAVPPSFAPPGAVG